MFQGSLLDAGEPEFGSLARIVRHPLTAGAWVDYREGWLAGADEVYADLTERVPWIAERRPMYERVVDVPRLVKHYEPGEALPNPWLDRARKLLNRHYRAELGEEFVSCGLCWYRDGRDSVAWHGDTIGRGSTEDTMVAILSVGAARTLALRPRAGGKRGALARRFELGHGDLLVMGGSCQRTWEHGIAKTRKPVGPRISIQFRPAGVR